MDRAYNRLGCGASLCLLALIIIGLPVTQKAIGCLVICLQFGRDAYFRHGLRFLPHRGFELTNHQFLWPVLIVAFVMFWMISMGLWILGSTLLMIGINTAIERNRDQTFQR
jgi:hypothetical protein